MRDARIVATLRAGGYRISAIQAVVTSLRALWISLQSHYELDRAEDLVGEQIAWIAPLGVE